MRVAWILLLAACGGRDVPAEAAVPASCGSGSTVALRRVAAGCGQSGAPEPPNCMNGGLTTARLQRDGTLDITGVDGDFPSSPSAIHEAGGGELYETETRGNLWRIEARP